MSPAGRIALGALLGSAVTLAAHPVSRPYALSVFMAREASQRAIAVDPTSTSLPPPSHMVAVSQWLQTAAERTLARKPLTAKEVDSVLRIAKAAARREPDNAFPGQMRAALLAKAGRGAEAEAEWIRAAHCAGWNDYQSARLLLAQSKIAAEAGANQAWQLGLVYYDRSDACARLIQDYARSLVRKIDTESERGLRLRFATLLNGLLLRNGSRSLHVGQYGANIIELAPYPPDLATDRSPRRLILAQHTLLNGLRRLNLMDEAARADAAFRDNDGWRALTGEDDEEEEIRALSLAAVVTSSAVSALLLLALFGGAVWLCGRLVDAFLSRHEKFGLLPVVASGIAVGIAVYAITGAWLTAMACGVCLVLLAVGPKRGRRVPPSDLGCMYSFTLASLTLAFVVIAGAFLLGATWPAQWLLPSLGVTPEYFGGSTLFVGLAGLILALLLLVVPMWATALRLPSPFVLGLTLRRFGSYLGCAGLLFGVLLGPGVVYLDRQIAKTLYELVANEPMYYLSRPDN